MIGLESEPIAIELQVPTPPFVTVAEFVEEEHQTLLQWATFRS